jgi:hypothetical protein
MVDVGTLHRQTRGLRIHLCQHGIQPRSSALCSAKSVQLSPRFGCRASFQRAGFWQFGRSDMFGKMLGTLNRPARSFAPAPQGTSSLKARPSFAVAAVATTHQRSINVAGRDGNPSRPCLGNPGSIFKLALGLA